MSFLRFLLVGVFSVFFSASLCAVDNDLARIPGYRNHAIFCFNGKKQEGYLFRPCSVLPAGVWTLLATYAGDEDPVKLYPLSGREFSLRTIMWAYDYTTFILNFSDGDWWSLDLEGKGVGQKLLSVCVAPDTYVVVVPVCFLVDGGCLEPERDLLEWHLEKLKKRKFNFICGSDLGALYAFSKFCSHNPVPKGADKSLLGKAITPFIEDLFQISPAGTGPINSRAYFPRSGALLSEPDSSSDSDSSPSPEPDRSLSGKRLECLKDKDVPSPTLVSHSFRDSDESQPSRSKRARNISENTVELESLDS